MEILGVVMTMSAACLGACLLQLPYRFATLGWPMASAYFFFAILLAHYFYQYIAIITDRLGAKTVEQLIYRTAGPKTALLISVCLAGMYFGGICAYCIIGADYIRAIYELIIHATPCIEPEVFDEGLCSVYKMCLDKQSDTSLYCKLIVGCGVFAVESFIGNLTILNKVSTAALAVVIFALISLMIRSVSALVTGEIPLLADYVLPAPRVPYSPSLTAILGDLPMFFGLFSLYAMITPIYADLQNNKLRTVKTAAAITILLGGTVYFVFGVFGSLIFYGQNQGRWYQQDNILLIFSQQDTLMTVVRVMYTIVIMVCFPVMLYALRNAIMGWTRKEKTAPGGKAWFYGSGLVVCVLVTLFSILVPQISVVMDLFNSLFGCVLFQLMPLLVIIYQRSQHNYRQLATESMDSPINDEDLLQEKDGDSSQADYPSVPAYNDAKLGKAKTAVLWVLFWALAASSLVAFIQTVVGLFREKNDGVCDV